MSSNAPQKLSAYNLELAAVERMMQERKNQKYGKAASSKDSNVGDFLRAYDNMRLVTSSIRCSKWSGMSIVRFTSSWSPSLIIMSIILYCLCRGRRCRCRMPFMHFMRLCRESTEEDGLEMATAPNSKVSLVLSDHDVVISAFVLYFIICLLGFTNFWRA